MSKRKKEKKKKNNNSNYSSESDSDSSSDSSINFDDNYESIEKIKSYRNTILTDKFGYTKESNPFNDADIDDVFLWKKKISILKAKGKTVPAISYDGLIKQTKDKICEIQNVKKRRENREAEDRLLEEHQALMARERDLEHYEEWKNNEESFHREMAMRRIDIRIRNNRPRPCDLLVKELRLLDGEDFEDKTLLPYYPDMIVDNLSEEDLKIFLKDLQINIDICNAAVTLVNIKKVDPNSSVDTFEKIFYERKTTTLPTLKALCSHLVFWNALHEVIQDLMSNKNKIVSSSSYKHRDITSGISLVVLNNIHDMLKTKSLDQLTELGKQVSKKLSDIRQNPNSGSDSLYWETICEKLPHYKKIAECRRIHDLAVQLVESSKNDSLVCSDFQNQNESSIENASSFAPSTIDLEKSKNSRSQKDSMKYYPYVSNISLHKNSSVALQTVTQYNEYREKFKNDIIEERKKNSEKKKNYKMTLPTVNDPSSINENLIYEKFVSLEKQTMEEDEYIMTPLFEVKVSENSDKNSNDVDHWSAKYKPRKPQFFNRVKTGYEWSKYNQTHYDRDNPPPKAVQGYKFNIFYLDILDKTKFPTWKLLPSDTSDTVLIQFHSGPPYEDLIFKIINREWDLNPRSGFKNTFDRAKNLHFESDMKNSDSIDEITCLKSIYGSENVKVNSSSNCEIQYELMVNIPLNIHEERNSLEITHLYIRIPSNYPDLPPVVSILIDNTCFSNQYVVHLINEVVSEEFIPGSESLFNIIEGIKMKFSSSDKKKINNTNVNKHEAISKIVDRAVLENNIELNIDIVTGERVTFKKSVFQAFAAKVNSYEQKPDIQQSMIVTPPTNRIVKVVNDEVEEIIEGNHSDGEHGAGKHLENLLNLLNIVDIIIVVVRWHGGIQLGAQRFYYIKKVAKELLLSMNIKNDGTIS